MSALFVLWLTRTQLEDLWRLLQSREEIVGRVQQYGLWGPVMVFILLVLQAITPMAPGQPVMITSGYLYGQFWGGLLTATAIFLSGEMGFIIARYAGRPAVYRLFSPKITDYWERMAANQGVLFYTCAFILPFFPSDLMLYVAGLGNISPRRFAYANLLGRLPLSVSITILGAYNLNPPAVFWFIPAITLFLAAVGLYKCQAISPAIHIMGIVNIMRKMFFSHGEVPS